MSKQFDWDNIENNTLAMIKAEFKRNGLATPKGKKEEYVKVLAEYHKSRSSTPALSPALESKTHTLVSSKLLDDEPEIPRKRERPSLDPATPQPKIQNPPMAQEEKTTGKATRQMSPPIATRIAPEIIETPVKQVPPPRNNQAHKVRNQVASPPEPIFPNKITEQIREASPITQTLKKNKKRDHGIAGFFFMLMELLLIFIIAVATFPIHPMLSVASVIITFFVCRYLIRLWKKNF